jgi:methylmalonyl-CoA/ethylmalonyl-CoA epimerase
MLKPLTSLEFGERGIIREIQGGCRMQKRLLALGIFPGKEIVKLNAMAISGPVIIRINGCEIALGRGMAKRILVEPEAIKALIKKGDEKELIGIEEVALAVRDSAKAQEFFEKILGIRFNNQWELPEEKIKVKSANLRGTQFQLLESIKTGSVVEKFIEKRGEGLHHIAFQVKNLSAWIKTLKDAGVKLIPEEPVKYSKGQYIFIHPESAFGVLIELIEYSENN